MMKWRETFSCFSTWYGFQIKWGRNEFWLQYSTVPSFYSPHPLGQALCCSSKPPWIILSILYNISYSLIFPRNNCLVHPHCPSPYLPILCHFLRPPMKVNGLAVCTSLTDGAFKSYLDLSDKKPYRFSKIKERILALRGDSFDQK